MSCTDAPIAPRIVGAHLALDVTDVADLVLAIAVADTNTRTAEQLDVSLDGSTVEVREIASEHGGRLHLITGVERGRLVIDYSATVAGAAAPQTATELEMVRYGQPSRYCQSDELGPLAQAEFIGLEATALLDAVSSWVGSNLHYVPGSSRPIDGAVSTLLSRQGVCRDYAHLCTALLRANGLPTRLVAVYAPGLDPMDFHAVAEVCLDGEWFVIDATCLAPRASVVRIATGADATDTAFLTTMRGAIELVEISVTAYVDGALPFDDVRDLVRLR